MKRMNASSTCSSPFQALIFSSRGIFGTITIFAADSSLKRRTKRLLIAFSDPIVTVLKHLLNAYRTHSLRNNVSLLEKTFKEKMNIARPKPDFTEHISRFLFKVASMDYGQSLYICKYGFSGICSK